MNRVPARSPTAEAAVEVRSYELDSFAHVNHAAFLNYLEYARFEALRQGGLPHRAMVERGWGVYVVRIEVDYLAEARLGDRLRIRTWVEGYRRSSMLIAQEIVRDDEPGVVVVRARVTAVWVGREGQPIRIPEEVRAALGEPPAKATGPA